MIPIVCYQHRSETQLYTFISQVTTREKRWVSLGRSVMEDVSTQQLLAFWSRPFNPTYDEVFSLGLTQLTRFRSVFGS